MDDEELAKRLHDLELSKRRLEEEQDRKDEELARNLAKQYSNEDRASMVARSRNQQVLRVGQGGRVRLQNPATNHMIGETCIIFPLDRNRIQFMVENRSGFFLRVDDFARVDFVPVRDGASTFIIEQLPGENYMHLLPEAHFHKVNSQGLLSWALALTPDGRLVGNGGRGPEAHWLLVAAQPAPIQNTPVAPTNAVQGQAKVAPGTTVGTVVSINNIDLEENNIIDLLSIGVHVSIPQQLQWLASPIGQLYLETCDPQIIQLYKDGGLKAHMYRPDWLISVKSWKNYPQLAYPFDADIVQTLLPAQKLDDFYDSGYLVLSNIVSNECVSAAYRLALYGASHDAASVHLSPYGHTELRGSFASDSEILALYYSSYLVHVIQYLLGPNDVQLPVKARVSLSYPSLSNTLFSTDSSSALAGSNWLIDGLTGPGTHSSSYTVLVGVALTDMSVPFSGNRCVFPRSHSELQSKCAQQVTSKSKVFSHPWSTPGKPSLMNPTQLLLQAGDVFLCHSRLAYLEAPNTSLNQIHGNVYFEISCTHHNAINETINDDLWAGFKCFGSTDSGIVEAHAVVENNGYASVLNPLLGTDI